MAEPNLVFPKPSKSRKRIGGTYSHKPGCPCNPCQSRQRTTEAVSVAAGKQVVTEGVINADAPLVTFKRSRQLVADWVTMRAKDPTVTATEAAHRLGVSPTTLHSYITKATREGWLKFEDSYSRLEHEIVPKVIDNLNTLLDRCDKTTTIETAKGTIFKTYQQAKGITDAPQTVLALKFEQSEPTAEVKVVTGMIVGRPRQLDG